MSQENAKLEMQIAELLSLTDNEARQIRLVIRAVVLETIVELLGDAVFARANIGLTSMRLHAAHLLRKEIP